MTTPEAQPDVKIELILDVPWPLAPPNFEQQLYDLAGATLARTGLDGSFELSLVITDEPHMRRVNRAQRGIDRSTDVLSFPLSARPLLDLPPDESWATMPATATPFIPVPGTAAHLGDIMLALPVVERQALAAGHSNWWEFCYLFIHGLLHLLGYDDATEAGYRAMVAHQEAILTTRVPKDLSGILSQKPD